MDRKYPDRKIHSFKKVRFAAADLMKLLMSREARGLLSLFQGLSSEAQPLARSAVAK